MNKYIRECVHTDTGVFFCCNAEADTIFYHYPKNNKKKMKTITDMHNLDLTDNTKLQINYRMRTKRISSCTLGTIILYTQLYMYIYICTCTIYIFLSDAGK